MIKIHNIPADGGKKQSTKRVGRGNASGQGRNSGKGEKGQKSRSGGLKGGRHEGGQMPLLRRLPKFGFTNIRFRSRRAEVTLGQLARFEEGSVVDMDALCEAGLISRQTEQVKVIATGEIKHKLEVKLHGFSAGARKAIEATGGVCEMIGS